MALVNKPTASLKITYRDASGSAGSTLIHVPFATLATVALAAGEALAATLPAITGCVVTAFALGYDFVEDAPGTPVAGSRVEDKGIFQWLCANGLTSTFSVPGILDTTLLPDGRVDLTNADIAIMRGVVENVGAIFSSISGSDIVTLAEAYQRFNRTTKRQAPPKR
jgi:hypothetical protein